MIFILRTGNISIAFVDPFLYICSVSPGGGMVDPADLKSSGPNGPCGFDSRPGHEKKFPRPFPDMDVKRSEGG